MAKKLKLLPVYADWLQSSQFAATRREHQTLRNDNGTEHAVDGPGPMGSFAGSSLFGL